MYDQINVLDHGYVRLIEDWGRGDAGEAEAGIIEAARQSTQGSFRGWDTDSKLLAFLYNNSHATPFEFAGMVIEVQAPILVFREWVRHRTQGYNEMSARYAPLPDLNYLPTVDRLMIGAGTNRQAGAVKDAEPLTREYAELFIARRKVEYARWQEEYEEALAAGVPKEVARIGMPVGRYSRMRATTSLRNWLGFLTLRMDPRAQFEIREFANSVGQIVAERFPQTWELFDHDRRN